LDLCLDFFFFLFFSPLLVSSLWRFPESESDSEDPFFVLPCEEWINGRLREWEERKKRRRREGASLMDRLNTPVRVYDSPCLFLFSFSSFFFLVLVSLSPPIIPIVLSCTMHFPLVIGPSNPPFSSFPQASSLKPREPRSKIDSRRIRRYRISFTSTLRTTCTRTSRSHHTLDASRLTSFVKESKSSRSYYVLTVNG